MPSARSQLEAVIPNAGTDSATVTVPQNMTLLGVHVPASMTGTALKFKALASKSDTPKPLRKSDNTDYSIVISSSAAYYPVDPSMFEGLKFLQLVSGSPEAAARSFLLEFGQT